MQTISIRLDDNLITKIEELRGSEHKSDFYRKLIEHALNTFEHKEITSDDKVITSDDKKITSDYVLLQAKNESLEELIKAKDQIIRNLENQNGFLIQDHTRISGQLDRLLMPAPEEIIKKNWWQFWK